MEQNMRTLKEQLKKEKLEREKDQKANSEILRQERSKWEKDRQELLKDVTRLSVRLLSGSGASVPGTTRRRSLSPELSVAEVETATASRGNKRPKLTNTTQSSSRAK
ncbi:hypothetical protein CALCODRAFT_31063 [Calocera cornea HHB12733]|uniref:Uncharacterized protein n=1 Tax=Calocera cornea HHB12733 TaxID=1353952 RepID=A0A165E315_9BASI|nr:hypothetical protein CALCODRAFT_31063 [Calocera cornea HHB12733]